MRFAALRRAERHPHDPHHNCQRRYALATSGGLPEHALAEEQEHEQPGGQGRLDDHERGEQQRHDL